MGEFNLPEWEETPKGFSTLLETLFRLTPPTALIIEESPRLVAAMQFLLERGFKVPEQVSLVSAEYDNTIEWCHPAFAHMRGNSLPIVRRIVRWVTAVQRGNADCKTINFPAKFIPGGTIGPVWKG
jgi:DNA-binding LacI/PurR family transcriptional regulator